MAERLTISAHQPQRFNDEQLRNARLEVARRSDGVDDCRELLAMLGLIDNPWANPNRVDSWGLIKKPEKQ